MGAISGLECDIMPIMLMLLWLRSGRWSRDL